MSTYIEVLAAHDRLEAELAFANRWISELVNELAEARAQIAAKDAEIERLNQLILHMDAARGET
jgi:uncharacterized coiled-coil protein SlyX